MAEWFHLACGRSIVRRACRYAIGVGTLLIVINHGDAILRRELSLDRLLRMALTVTVPSRQRDFSVRNPLRYGRRLAFADSVERNSFRGRPSRRGAGLHWILHRFDVTAGITLAGDNRQDRHNDRGQQHCAHCSSPNPSCSNPKS